MSEQEHDPARSDKPAEDVAAQEPQEEHHPDGLDFARSQMRSAAGAATTPARRLPRRTPQAGSSAYQMFRRKRAGGAQMSGARPDGRDPQGLGSEVDRLIDGRGWGLDLQVRAVFARWSELVGSEIGSHSTPETLVDGTLVVRTDSTAWATQLKLLTATVVKRLNEELGEGTVTIVEVLGPLAPSWKHGRRSTRDSRGPRDTYG